jgi:hypothetical protein
MPHPRYLRSESTFICKKMLRIARYWIISWNILVIKKFGPNEVHFSDKCYGFENIFAEKSGDLDFKYCFLCDKH